MSVHDISKAFSCSAYIQTWRPWDLGQSDWYDTFTLLQAYSLLTPSCYSLGFFVLIIGDLKGRFWGSTAQKILKLVVNDYVWALSLRKPHNISIIQKFNKQYKLTNKKTNSWIMALPWLPPVTELPMRTEWLQCFSRIAKKYIFWKKMKKK